MKKPDIAVHWMESLECLDALLDPSHGKPPAVLRPTDERAYAPRLLVSTAQDPRALYEYNASFCSLLCAADAYGNAVLLHEPLAAETVGKQLASFRKAVEELLHEPRMALHAGAQGRIMTQGPDPAVYRAVRSQLDDLLPVEAHELSPRNDRGERMTAEGMLYLPPAFTRSGRPAVLLAAPLATYWDFPSNVRARFTPANEPGA